MYSSAPADRRDGWRGKEKEWQGSRGRREEEAESGSGTALALRIFVLDGLLILLLCSAGILAQEAGLEEVFGAGTVGDFVVELVFEHVSLQLGRGSRGRASVSGRRWKPSLSSRPGKTHISLMGEQAGSGRRCRQDVLWPRDSIQGALRGGAGVEAGREAGSLWTSSERSGRCISWLSSEFFLASSGRTGEMGVSSTAARGCVSEGWDIAGGDGVGGCAVLGGERRGEVMKGGG